MFGLTPLYHPFNTLGDWLAPVKYGLGLCIPGVYQISWSRGQPYIGQTGRIITERIKQDSLYIRLKQPEKSGLAEHCMQCNHQPLFDANRLLSKEEGFRQRLIIEAIYI